MSDLVPMRTYDFRRAVAQVQADAARGNLTALEKTLHDPNAERAARLAAANLLARAGAEGQHKLLTAILFTSGLSKLASVQAYLRAQPRADEAFLIEASHSKHRPTRRAVRGMLLRLPYPMRDELRLRCCLPLPLCNVPNVEESLAEWLHARGENRWRAVNAVVSARYLTAIPILLDAAEPETYEYQKHGLLNAIVRIGSPAVPTLLDLLNRKPKQRPLILYALSGIRDPRAKVALDSS